MEKRPMPGRFRIVLLWTAIAVLALSSASAAATPPFVAKLKDTLCLHTGGVLGHGTFRTTPQMTENRRNGTNYMAFKVKFQQKDGHTWTAIDAYGPFKSAPFANDAASHTHSEVVLWTIRDMDVGETFRWKVTFEWWDSRSGPDVRVASTTKKSVTCTA